MKAQERLNHMNLQNAQLILRARAKINLSLSVQGRRADGYHELDMLTQSVELSDTLTFSQSDVISLSVTGDLSVPGDGRNLALKAARLLQDTYKVSRGVAISLTKRIPSGAGLGGGSADAAAVLHGLNRLWGLSIPEKTLQDLAISLGADVPFCLVGGLMRVRGIGERITPVPNAPRLPVVIVKPDAGLSTANVFTQYDHLEKKPTNPCIEAAVEALSSSDRDAFSKSLGNALFEPAVSLLPEIYECVLALEALGAAKAQMTGSGSAVFGLFFDEGGAKDAYEKLVGRWSQTYLTKTVGEGIIHCKS